MQLEKRLCSNNLALRSVDGKWLLSSNATSAAEWPQRAADRSFAESADGVAGRML
jgi:hypothetical protein